MGLDDVEMMMQVEEAFDITIDESRYTELRSVGGLVACVERTLSESGRERPADLAETIIAIVSDVSGTPAEEIHADSRFYEDLNLG
ncbi:MAG: hypothetical protein HQ546_11080 [Planctomycetes bacterium]|nr:hypothetical protein [Planctomycetota bacterium]